MANPLGDVNSLVASVVGGANILIWVFVIIIAVGTSWWWFWYNKQFKYLVKLKVLRHNDFVYWEDTAKLVDNDGSKFWKLRRLKVLAQIPPNDSTYSNTSGKFVAEGYYSRDAGIFWSRDKMSRVQFQKLEEEIIDMQLHPEKRHKEKIIEAEYQPMTTSQRSLQAVQITRAIERRGKTLWEMLMPLAFGLIMLIALFLVFIFWDKISKPVMDLQASNVEIQSTNSAIQQQNLRLYMMLTGGRGNGTYVVQELPQDSALFGVKSVASQAALAAPTK